MITKFDSLYAGHTDLDNVGYGGTPINERRYSNAHLATALSKAESMAKLMDGLGYNCFWMAEHHFQREGTECIPNTILMALHLAHRTKNIKIGCGFNITPMWHPLRLARTSPPLTSSPAAASSLASVAATTRARWKRSVLPCATRRPTERSTSR
jgi:hypothetical protein